MPESESRPVAAVIGVGPGLGASLARRFAAKYAVAINARSTDYLRTLANDIRGRGGVALEAQANVGKPDEVRDAFELIRSVWGGQAKPCTFASCSHLSSGLQPAQLSFIDPLQAVIGVGLLHAGVLRGLGL